MPYSQIAKDLLAKHHFHIIENAMCGIGLVDSEFKFLYLNKKFLQILEYSAAEVVGRKFAEFTAPSDVKADEDMCKAVLDGTIDSYQMVKKYITKTGKIVQVVLVVRSYRDDAKVFEIFVPNVLESDNPELVSMVGELKTKIDEQDDTISNLASIIRTQTEWLQKAMGFLSKHWLKIVIAIAIIAAAVNGADVQGLITKLGGLL